MVDARPQHTTIGQLLQRDGWPVAAEYEAGLPTTLQSFFDFFTPGQPDATPLLLRVTRFELAETPSAGASLVGEVFVPQPDSTYQHLLHLALHTEVPPSFFSNSTKQHPANVGQLLRQAAQLMREAAARPPAPTHYPATYVQAKSPHPAEGLPVLAPDWRPRAGIYHSLPEFWHNAPAEPGRPEVEATPYHTTEWAGDSLLRPYRRTLAGRREAITDAWGFSDGNRFYVWRRGYYYPLESRGAGFTYRGPAGDDAAYRATVNTQAAGRAAVYGAVAAIATSPSLERRVRFSLNPLTGEGRADASALAPPPAARPTQLYLYRARAAKGPAVRVRLVGTDEPTRELAAGDFVSFMATAGQPVQLCLQAPGGTETCQQVLPTPETATYLEYQPGQSTLLQPVPAKTGAAALERLVR